MINCTWAHSLSRYNCREVKDLAGGAMVEVGTPFTMLHGSAIVLYIGQVADDSVLISDNGDTLAHLSSAGVDLDHGARLNKLRDVIKPFGMILGNKGDFRLLARVGEAPYGFAQAVSGMLAVSQWATAQLHERPEAEDLGAIAEPFILARNPNLPIIRKKEVVGASNTKHEFMFLHGGDLIDVIPPKQSRTGAAMRKAADVQSGPEGMDLHPLIVVDDRSDPERAEAEIGILGAVTRAMPMSRLMAKPH